MQNFNPISASDILAWEPGPTQWIWEKFIPVGSLFLFAGYMKSGKSTLIYPLAVSVAHGRAFLESKTRRCGVLILALEEQWVAVRSRLQLFGMQPSDPIFVHCGPLDSTFQNLKALEDFIQQNQIGLVLVDTLSMFWSVLEENDNAKVIREVKPLLHIARITQAAVGLVHHTSKAGGELGRSIRGASSLLGIVDQAMILEMRQGGKQNQRILKTIGRYSESPAELVLELEGNQWKSLGTGSDAYKEDQLEHLIGCLTKQPQPVTWIVTASELSEKQVRKSLGILIERGEIVKSGSGLKGDPFLYRLK